MRIWLSGVRNQTHLLYAASWLQTIAPQGVRVGVLDAGGFVRSGLVTEAQFETWLGSIPGVTVDFGANLKERSGDEAYLAIGVPGIKPLMRLKIGRPFSKLPVVVVDEGLGSYGSFATLHAAQLRQRGRRWPALRRALTTRASSAMATLKWPLYVKDGSGWHVSELVASQFRQVGTVPQTNLVFYLAQPWVELGQVSEGSYLDHLRRVAVAVEGTGHEFRVKPHPLEDISRYVAAGLAVHDSGLPSEIDPVIKGARALLGTTSTALLNCVAIHALPGRRVTCPGLEHIEMGLGRDQRSLLEHVLGVPGGVDSLPTWLNGLGAERAE